MCNLWCLSYFSLQGKCFPGGVRGTGAAGKRGRERRRQGALRCGAGLPAGDFLAAEGSCGGKGVARKRRLREADGMRPPRAGELFARGRSFSTVRHAREEAAGLACEGRRFCGGAAEEPPSRGKGDFLREGGEEVRLLKGRGVGRKISLRAGRVCPRGISLRQSGGGRRCGASFAGGSSAGRALGACLRERRRTGRRQKNAPASGITFFRTCCRARSCRRRRWRFPSPSRGGVRGRRCREWS